MHTVLSDGLRVGIKNLMATARGPRLKYRGVSSQQRVYRRPGPGVVIQ